MRGLRTFPRFAEVASAAVWASLGAALVIHGCAQEAPRRDPVAARPSVPVPATPAPAPAPAPVSPPAAAAPPPVHAERPAVPAFEPTVRIRIAALRRAQPVVRLSNASGRLLMQGDGLEPRPMRTPVDVRPQAGGWRVVEGAGSRSPAAFDVAMAGPVEFHPPAGRHGSVGFDGTDWPGPLRIVRAEDGPDALDLVVDVPLERYLPGVLAKELIRSWDPAAFRAQAIAARSFAICERAHWAGVRHYDMVAGEASQAWIGSTADAKPREAVAATRGMVLAFEGRVVPAYYSSTCGGTPACAGESLTRNPNHAIAPLSAGASGPDACRTCCADAPRYRWEQSLGNASACAQLRRWAGDQLQARRERDGVPRLAGPSTGPAPAAVEAASDAAAPGAVARAVPEAPLGAQVPASAGSTRTRPIALAELADDAPLEELSGLRAIRRIDVVASNAAGRPSRLRLTDQDGRTFDLRAEEFRRAVNYAREGEAPPKERLFSSHLTSAAVRGDRIELSGRGFGHGVGMCQYGAQAMAGRGLDAAAILRTYYPGASVVRAY